jgi:glycosyltransferase involved in cell wall biosynthesis
MHRIMLKIGDALNNDHLIKQCMVVTGLVSIIIPTKNSSATILSCLESIKNQTYSNIEIIVVDSIDSGDGTKEICEREQVTVFQSDWKTLGARYLGLKKSSGEYILSIDSDQTLEKTCIQTCIDTIVAKGYDMLCLEELTYNPQTFFQKLFAAHRLMTYDEQSDMRVNPIYGSLVPRFYRRSILEKAFDMIPKAILPFCFSVEDNITYYEASKLSNRVGIIHSTIWHQDPKNLIEYWPKLMRYGKNMRELARTGYYPCLISLGSSWSHLLSRERKKRKIRNRSRLSKNKILSSILLFLTEPAFVIGFYSSR